MKQRKVDNTNLQIVAGFYAKNLLAVLAFIGLFLFVFINKNSDIKHSIEKLNYEVQSSIRQSINVIKNDLYIKAKMLNQGIQSDISIINSDSINNIYSSFYILDQDLNVIVKYESKNTHKIENFNMQWLNGLKSRHFIVSDRIYKSGRFEAVFAAYKVNDNRCIVVEINSKFLDNSIGNVLKEDKDEAYLLDKYGNLLNSKFNKNFNLDIFSKFISMGDEFSERNTIFSLFDINIASIDYMRDLGIFVVTSSNQRSKIFFQFILLAFSCSCFLAFIVLWIRDVKFIKNSILDPLENISKFLHDRGKRPKIDMMIRDLRLITVAIDELYKEVDLANLNLEEYKNRFDCIFEQSFLIIIVYDSYTGDIIDVSEAALKFYGYSRDEIMGLNIKDIYKGNFGDVAYKRRESIEGFRPFKLTHTLKNGEEREVSVVSSLITLKDKKLNFNVITDVTQEEKLEKNSEILQRYMPILPSIVMIARKDEPFIIQQKGGNIEQIFGLDKFKSENIDIRTLVSKERVYEFVSKINYAKELFALTNGEKDTLKFDTSFIACDGERRPFGVYVKFVLDDNGIFDRIIYHISDISELKELERRYEKEQIYNKNIIWATQAVEFEWNQNSNIIHIDNKFANMLGYSNINELGTLDFEHFKDLLVDKFSSFNEMFDKIAIKNGVYLGDIKFYMTNKSIVWISLRAKALEFDENGEPTLISGVAINSTQQNENSLYQEMLSRLFSYAKDGVAVVGIDRKIIDANEAFSDMSGYRHDELVGKDILSIKSGLNDIGFDSKILSDIDKKGFWQDRVWNKNKLGENSLEIMNVSPISLTNGCVHCYVIITSNISDVKSNQDYLEHIAYHDPLTRLPNRFLFSHKLENIVVNLKDDESVAIAYLDLDGLKAINDTYGHLAGDAFLIEISSRIDKLFDERDMFARLGGDEFVAILPYKRAGEVYEIVENMLRIASGEVEFDKNKLKISASIGVSMSGRNKISPEDLLEQADWAMYQAKLGGKNRYYVFNQAKDRNFKNQYEDGSKILKALKNDEFFLEYQPTIDIKTGKIVSFEALIRWNSQNGTIIYPENFLNLIKKQFIVDDVAIFTIKRALEAQSVWYQEGTDAKVCVNLSIDQICDDGFFNKFSDLLSSHTDLNANALCIEIIDANAAKDLSFSGKFMQRYKNFGVKFVLDDFASRSSSFEALTHLPIDSIKLDKKLTDGLFKECSSFMMLKAIKELSETFECKASVKNIEDINTLNMLIRFGYDVFQGNLISKPLKLDEILKFTFVGFDGLNLDEELNQSEFERLKECVKLREYALQIISNLKDAGCTELKYELITKLENSDSRYTNITRELIAALKSEQKSEALEFAKYAKSMCDELLNLEQKDVDE
ncbi:EAL domain-containing protein [Campylobacter sp. faydin G-140]|uniref:EAL domain-containing protein n=1 Tax=Campylobacter anatolicus TaxID=2829105 RepID=UPI001BA00CBF|nr:EAL domain-containing protein [Campylobacter anatolicus]MBR8465264.1 EAL domain-containing protein [Campylobacter anatolicus]